MNRIKKPNKVALRVMLKIAYNLKDYFAYNKKREKNIEADVLYINFALPQK